MYLSIGLEFLGECEWSVSYETGVLWFIMMTERGRVGCRMQSVKWSSVRFILDLCVEWHLIFDSSLPFFPGIKNTFAQFQYDDALRV